VRGIFIPSGSRLWLNNISYHFVASYILRLIENSDGCMYHNDRFLKKSFWRKNLVLLVSVHVCGRWQIATG